MVQELLQRSNRTVHDILADVNKVAKMKLATDSPGPLMILTTVHKAKVISRVHYSRQSSSFSCPLPLDRYYSP